LDNVTTQYFVSWRVGLVFNTAVQAALVEQWNLTSYWQIGLLQWGLPNGVLDGHSFKDFVTSLPGIPEYGIYASRYANPLPATTLTLSSIEGIFNVCSSAANLLAFVNQLPNPLTTYLPQASDQSAFLQYLSNDIIPDFIKPTVNALFQNMVVYTATPHQILFGRIDPFLESLVGPSQANVSGVFDDTTPTYALSYPPDKFYTGASDPSKTMYRITFNGSEYLNIYDPPQIVEGFETLSFVGPGTLNSNNPPSLTLWVSEVVRYFNLVYDSDSTVQGIPSKHYKGDTSSPSLLESTVWNNPSNYLLGLEAYYGIPIYFSLSNFYLVDPTISTDLLNGIPPTDPDMDNVFFDFEPISGITLSVFAPLQASLYVSSSSFNGPNSGIASDRYYPLYTIVRNAQISSSDAQALNQDVVQLVQSITSALIILLVLGILTFIAGIVFIVFYLVQKRASGNDDEVEMK